MAKNFSGVEVGSNKSHFFKAELGNSSSENLGHDEEACLQRIYERDLSTKVGFSLGRVQRIRYRYNWKRKICFLREAEASTRKPLPWEN